MGLYNPHTRSTRFWRVSTRVGAPPHVWGDYPKKADAMRVLKDFMKRQNPVDEYDSAQAVPYRDEQRDWGVDSVRFVPRSVGVQGRGGFKWSKGESIR